MPCDWTKIKEEELETKSEKPKVIVFSKGRILPTLDNSFKTKSIILNKLNNKSSDQFYNY